MQLKKSILAILMAFSGLAMACVISRPAEAEIVSFKVTGNGGDGLLASNVTPGTNSAGEGGIGLTGITLNTLTNILHVDINWGTANGYSGDLTDPVTVVHLHGPTPSNSPDSFSETGPLMVVFSSSLSFNDSPINGGLVDDFFINSADIQAILDGRTYVNVHTANNPMGEIRGYLVTVPEPCGLVFWIAGSSLILVRRKSS